MLSVSDLRDSWNWVKENPRRAPAILAALATIPASGVATELWKRPHEPGRDLVLTVLGTYLASAAILLLGFWVWFRLRALPRSFREDQIGILIAEVAGDTSRQRQIAYALAIREQIEKYPELSGIVKVRLLKWPLPDEPETQHKEALRIGRQRKATLVLRSYSIEGVQKPYISVIPRSQSSVQLGQELQLGKFSNSEFANIEQLPLPGDVILVSQCILAYSFLRISAYGEAVPILDRILAAPVLPEIGWGRPFWKLGLADALHHTRQDERAIAVYRSIIGSFDLPGVHSNLGVSLGREDRLDESIREFDKAIVLDEGFAHAYGNRAITLFLKGETHKAISDLKHAVALDPEYGEAKNLLAAVAEGRLNGRLR